MNFPPPTIFVCFDSPPSRTARRSANRSVVTAGRERPATRCRRVRRVRTTSRCAQAVTRKSQRARTKRAAGQPLPGIVAELDRRRDRLDVISAPIIGLDRRQPRSSVGLRLKCRPSCDLFAEVPIPGLVPAARQPADRSERSSTCHGCPYGPSFYADCRHNLATYIRNAGPRGDETPETAGISDGAGEDIELTVMRDS